MTKPIRPDDIGKAKVNQDLQRIPSAVIEAFNECIAAGWDGRKSVFTQTYVLGRILTKMGCERSEVFEKRWLDVEPIYEREGWSVEYDRPGYCESYEPTFTFKRRTR